MGLRGPAKQPAFLSIIKGNPGKRPIREAPVTPGTRPVQTLPPPDHFDDDQKLLWNKVTHVLALVGALAIADQFTLARYVELLHQYNLAQHALREYQKNPGTRGQLVYVLKGESIETDDEGNTTKREKIKSVRLLPHIDAMMRLSTHLLRLEQQFGLTPSSRAMWGQPLGGLNGEGNQGDEFLD